jgi:lipopolysaccharide export LptBFGC system permease protein LptF
MRACGISLYRSSLPILVFAAIFSGVLFELEEHVLASSNREAQRLNAAIRGWPVQNFGVLDRRWIVGTGGDIYHYELFNPAVNQFSRLSLFRVDHAAWRLESLTFARDVSLVRQPVNSGQPSMTWVARQGWAREFRTAKKHNRLETAVNYSAFAERPVSLEPPKFFNTPEPDADRMTYGDLKRYTEELKTSGYSVVAYTVELQRKIAFPFVTVIMALLALPFAVTTGRRGALYGSGSAS